MIESTIEKLLQLANTELARCSLESRKETVTQIIKLPQTGTSSRAFSLVVGPSPKAIGTDDFNSWYMRLFL